MLGRSRISGSLLRQALEALDAVATRFRPAPSQIPPRRPFAASSASPDADAADAETKAKFVRFFAAIFMLSAGARVAPYAAASGVEHAVKLLDAEERLLVSAGLGRLTPLLALEAARKKAAECGAVPRLAGVVDRAVGDADFELAALAVAALAAVAPGGAPQADAALRRFLAEVPRMGGTEDALREAKQLLDAGDRGE